MNETVVRSAVPEDGPELLEHTRRLHDENGLFSYDEAKVSGLLQSAFGRRNGVIGVIGEVGHPEASIYLSLQQTYYSNDWQLVELWNFVAPPRQHRAGHAKKLIEFAKRCSDQLQMPLSIGILSNQRVEPKIRLYRRQLEEAGAFFIYNRRYAGLAGEKAGAS